jgi:hypothetical protein
MTNTFPLFFSKLNRTSGHVNMPGRCTLSAHRAGKLIVKTDKQTETEKDTYVKLCDKKNQAIIDYTVGVQQGDNMAGLLFLFLMQAMDESFKKQCALPKLEFRTHRDSKRGRLLKQPAPAKTKGVPFHFGKSMFADDATYIVSSRQELEMLCATIFHHMRHFGLLMHAGTLDENGNHQMKSKTEAMFIPAPHDSRRH